MNNNDRLMQLESLLADALHRLDHMTAQMNQLVDFQQQLTLNQEQLVVSQQRLVDSQQRANHILENTMEVFRITDQRFRRVEEFMLKPDKPRPDPQP